MSKPKLDDIHIRTTIEPGDLGYITYMHGYFYHKEYNFGLAFETYVAEGLIEFYSQYNPASNRAWVCEHNHTIIGFLVLMNRGDSAQLRYFILDPNYRGIGLGKKLMELYMNFMNSCGYKKSYLWTTKELLPAICLYTRHGFTLTDERETNIFERQITEVRFDLVVN
ncbi:MAG: GNAT family N-acetyltransferase [Cyclobacteriaceae bacterium]